MPINGRRIDEFTTTSGAVLQADDYFHIIDSVAGGYTNKKISVAELAAYIASTDSEPYIPLSGSSNIAGSLVPNASSTFSLGTSGYPWLDLFVSSGSVYFDDQKLTVDSNGDLYINDTIFIEGTDFTAISAYNPTTSQSLGQSSGTMLWTDTISDAELEGYSLSATQVYTNVSGVINWMDTTENAEISGYDPNTNQLFTHLSGVVQWYDMDSLFPFISSNFEQITVVTDVQLLSTGELEKTTRTVYVYSPGTESAWTSAGELSTTVCS